jgi:hypothetical protein
MTALKARTKRKHPGAVALGRKGGRARMQHLTSDARQAFALRAIQMRWAKRQRGQDAPSAVTTSVDRPASLDHKEDRSMTVPMTAPAAAALFSPTSTEYMRACLRACLDSDVPVGILRILNELINRVEELEAKR